MTKQAKAVHELTLKHNNLHFARWREVQVPLQDEHPPHLEQAEEALDGLEAEIIAEQRAAAQPKARRYVLTPE
jgi:hypothetical protein